MWEYMVSDVHSAMKKSYGLGGSRRDIFLRSLRLCLVQSKSNAELTRRLDSLVGEASRNNCVDVLTSLRPSADVDELCAAAAAAREGPLRLNLLGGLPKNLTRENGAESNNYLTQTTYESLYGGCLLYTSPSPRDLSTSRMPSSA